MDARNLPVNNLYFLSLSKSVIMRINYFFIWALSILSLEISMAQSDTLAPVQAFWSNLESLCGKAYSGELVHGPENDTVFADKTMLIYASKCAQNNINIHLMVGEDRSRTWIFTSMEDRILLKHDHRHEDGSPDLITFYGGLSTNTGSAQRQIFPADQETADMLPAAAANIWWVDLHPGELIAYNLRRMGSDRYFSIRFNLNTEVPKPDSAWGW
jgi:hypothetical protein